MSFLFSENAFFLQIGPNSINEGLDGGGVWYSLFIKHLVHYSSH